MPIDHEEMQEKTDLFRIKQMIGMQEDFISQHRHKKQPDLIAIEKLVKKKDDLLNEFNIVDAKIKQRQQASKK